MVSLKTAPMLTKTQIDGLTRIRDQGPAAWCPGARAGGAVRRMFQTLADMGLCKVWPPTITKAGRQALTDIENLNL